MNEVNAVNISNAYAPPDSVHWLGTDYLGRDLLHRMGAAVVDASLPVMASVGAGFALAIMIFMAWLPRRFPAPLTSTTAMIRSLPAGLLAFGVLVLSGGQHRFELVLLVIGVAAFTAALDFMINSWERDRHLGFWEAHDAIGGSARQRAWLFGVRQGWSSGILQLLALTIQTSLAIEATLGYLGLGMQEPRASLGNIIAAHYDRALKGYPLPVIAAVVTLLALGLVPRLVTRIMTGRMKLSAPPHKA